MPDLSVGILMVLIGVACLVCSSVRASARPVQEPQEADEGDTRTAMKPMKLIGIATLIVGIGWILILAFHIF